MKAPSDPEELNAWAERLADLYESDDFHEGAVEAPIEQVARHRLAVREIPATPQALASEIQRVRDDRARYGFQSNPGDLTKPQA